MRASRQPADCAATERTSAIVGSSSIAGASRSLRSLTSAAHKRGGLPSPLFNGRGTGAGGACGQRSRLKCREHVLGRHRHAGIDQHRRQRRQIERVGQDLADAAHHARPRIETDRHVGAGRACRLPSAAGSSSAMPLARASSRSAAAASAEPPPSPAATGSRFDSAKRPSLSPPIRSASVARGLEHEIVGDVARGRCGRSAHGERQARDRARTSGVADAGEDDQALDVVIAVGATAETRSVRLTLAGARSARAVSGMPWSLAAARLLRGSASAADEGSSGSPT